MIVNLYKENVSRIIYMYGLKETHFWHCCKNIDFCFRFYHGIIWLRDCIINWLQHICDKTNNTKWAQKRELHTMLSNDTL